MFSTGRSAFCFVLVAIIPWTYAAFFASLSAMEPLMVTHKAMVDNLQDYINKEQDRQNIIRKYLKLFKEEYKIATADVIKYLKDPLNSFILKKRLSVDLDVVEKTIKLTSDYKKKPKLNYPTSEDFMGAAEALSRLCDTYDLNVKDMADGILIGVFKYASFFNYLMMSKAHIQKNYENKTYIESVAPMTASDCLELGSSLYKLDDYKNGLPWILEAYNKFQAEKHEMYQFDMADIVEHISYAYHKLDDLKKAIKWTKKLVDLRPSVHFADILQKLEAKLAKEDEENRMIKNTKTRRIEAKKRKSVLLDTKCVSCSGSKQADGERILKIYKTLCRGQMNVSNLILKRLKCRYVTENHPFLKLAPIKVEQLHLEPEVLLFHEVISDKEIQHLKHISKAKLERAWVARDNEHQTAAYRISETAWFRDHESAVVEHVSRRVSDLTGLSMERAEMLQVNNYGIGGHFAPHADPKGHGTARIATVMFYMSEVSQGGATVFPKLGLSVFPARGAALFWWNLLPSGDRDLAVMHAGCPVLRGDKWVANKWIDGLGQELIRPCQHKKEGYLHQIPLKKF